MNTLRALNLVLRRRCEELIAEINQTKDHRTLMSLWREKRGLRRLWSKLSGYVGPWPPPPGPTK